MFARVRTNKRSAFPSPPSFLHNGVIVSSYVPFPSPTHASAPNSSVQFYLYIYRHLSSLSLGGSLSRRWMSASSEGSSPTEKAPVMGRERLITHFLVSIESLLVYLSILLFAVITYNMSFLVSLWKFGEVCANFACFFQTAFANLLF